jgi:ABC-type glycerol-3-phosphate transport system substrate-binding protein
MTVSSDGNSARGIGRRSLLKGVGAIGAVALSAPLLAACGSSSDGKTADGKTKVRVVSWMGFEPGRKDAWKAVCDAFNAQSKTIEVSLVGWPFTQYPNNVLTQTQSGSLQGDLITAPPDLAARLLSLGQFLPATEAVSAAKVTPDAKLHDFMRKDGVLYGVSTVTVGFGLLYNEQILTQAGLKPATSPDEWVAQGKQLTQRPDKFGIIQANTLAEEGSFWFNLQNTINAYDGVWAKGKTPMVTSDPVIKTMELFKSLYDTSIPKGLNDAQMMSLMGDGRAAMGLVVSATVNVLKTGSPQIYGQLRSSASPWSNKKATSRVHPIGLYKGTKNKEAATEFLAWLLKPENMAMLTMKSLDAIPPYPELNDVPEFATYLKDLPWLPGYQDVTPVTPMDLMGDFINNNDEFGHILLTNFQDSLASGKPIAETMAKAQTQLEDLATRLK